MNLPLFEFILESIAIICFFINVLHSEIIHSHIKIFFSVFLSLIYALYLFFPYTFPIIIPESFILFGIIFLLFADKWYFKLCWCFIFSLTLNIVTTMINYFYQMITNISAQQIRTYHIYFDFISILLLIIGSFYLKHKLPAHTKPFRNIHIKGYIVIIMVSIIDFFLASFSALLAHDTLTKSGRYVLLLAIFITIFMSIILLIMYFRLEHYHSILQQNNNINQKMLHMEEQHYQDLQKKNNDLRAFRHDYNYHITSMQALARHDELDKLKRYVENLSDIQEQTSYLSTNHPVADAILNYFHEKCPETVEFQIEGKLPEQLFVSDSDLCIILSNLLRNAVEAVEKLSADRQPIIRLSVSANTEYMSILIENSSEYYPEHPIEELQTSKNDSLNHGFGIKNIQECIRKYHGTLDLHYKAGIFYAGAYLRNID